MEKSGSIFLTVEQALDAICRDLQQYEPQVNLMCELYRLLTGRFVPIDARGQAKTVWLPICGQKKMRMISDVDLVAYMVQMLKDESWTPEKMAAACRLVFQTRFHVACEIRSHLPGVCMHMGLETFKCRQCGHCCRNLEYGNQISAEDVQRWRQLQRDDILQWVGTFKAKDHQVAYRMWMAPGTRQRVSKCPFLKKLPTVDRSICTIQDVKPGICRNYPLSRKHAHMTGCPGFG